MKSIVTKQDIVQGLTALGIEAGDTVMLHSALSSLGQVEGGAQTVVDAFLELIGKDGTLASPTFASDSPFNKDTSPTYLGSIPEAVRTHKDAVRSLHPLVALSAIGKHADDIVKDHEKQKVPQGMQSPYGKLIDLNAKVVLLGVDFDRCTLLHTVEILANAPYLSNKKGSYLDAHGKQRTGSYEKFPGPHRDFVGLTHQYRAAGLLKTGQIGNAVVQVINAKDIIDEGLKAMQDDLAAVLCDNPACPDCVMQRSKIYADRLKQEAFTLSVVSDIAGKYIDEIIENLSDFGITTLELFHVQGRELCQLPADEVAYLFKRLSKKNITVNSIRISHLDYLSDAVAYAEKFSVPQVVLPLNSEWINAIVPTENVEILVENNCQRAIETAALLKQRQAKGIGLVFNPFNFAKVKENPFLVSLTRGRVKKYIRQLAINDGTFSGTPTALAHGNGEIAELISILRCSSFDGIFVLDGVAGTTTFEERVSSFWKIMDQM